MPRNKRITVKCIRCAKTLRTRNQYIQEHRVCRKCTWNNVKKGLPVTKENAHELHWKCMREDWFHELVYQQVEQNGLIALGLGRLTFEREQQRSHRVKGKYRSTQSGYTNEYDIRLRTRDGEIVIVELKKVVEEEAIAQTLRYSRTVKDEGHDDPHMVLVGVEYPDKTLASLRELIALRWNVRAFFISPSPRGFQLVRISDAVEEVEKEPEEDRRPGVVEGKAA